MENDGKRRKRVGDLQQKIIMLLMGGLAIGLSGSPKTAFRVIRGIKREWERIDEKALRRSIKKLYQSKLVDVRECPDGTVTLVLSEEGKRRAVSYNMETMALVRPVRWDGRWRVVLFDIPERLRRARDAFRAHLNELGFVELQHSVFVVPYPCEREIEFLVEFYGIKKFVRTMQAVAIDNELELKKRFNIR